MAFQDCEFSGNNASVVGGALSHDAGGQLTLTSSLFSGNWAAYGGGAISVFGVNQVIFSGVRLIIVRS